MTAFASETVLSVFVLFCRIGACLMLIAGFSSMRIPPQVRLLVAFAVTLVLTPLHVQQIQLLVAGSGPEILVKLVVRETMTGAVIGLLGRFMLLALQFVASGIAASTGFGMMPGTPIDDNEPAAAFVSLFILTAIILVFVTEQHWAIIRALSASYAIVPPGEPLSARFALAQLSDRISDAFFLCFQIASPFFVYAIVVNFAVGLTNKLTPQIPIYFIALPFVLAGGIVLLYFTFSELMTLFITAFADWITLR